jgi:hypothetical protein
MMSWACRAWSVGTTPCWLVVVSRRAYIQPQEGDRRNERQRSRIASVQLSRVSRFGCQTDTRVIVVVRAGQ